MSNFRSDPTAGAAIGAVDREFGLLKKQALKIQELQKRGLLTDEQLAAAGIPAGLVRMSCGLESSADLIADIAQALDQVK